jgi:predicted AAA+ superfamily ATPase
VGTRDTSLLEWGSFLRDSLIESVFGKDLLSMFPLQKHEVLRKTFAVACANASEIVSYNRLAEAVPEAGSTNTVARYFEGLEKAFLIARVPRWRGTQEQVKDSAPKIVIRDNGLITSILYPTLDKKQIDDVVFNRLRKNFAGAVLVTLAEQLKGKLYYFRDRDVEVDFILQIPGRLVSIQVVTGDIPKANHGLRIFKRRFPEAEMVTVGPFQPKGDIRVKYWIPFFKNPASILEVDDGAPRKRKKLVNVALSRYCEMRVPAHVREKLRVIYKIDGNAVTKSGPISRTPPS